MANKNYRPLLLMVVLCSTAGVVLGGTSSWAESNQCLNAPVVTNKCLTQDAMSRTLEGMGTGLLAGMGAAIGVAWHVRRNF
jgi:hypothetical protein